MPRVLAAALVAVLAFAGCGSDDSKSSSSGGSGTESTPAQVVDFPQGRGKTMRALRDMAPEAGVFAPSVSVLRKGTNRVGFALFDTSRKQLTPDAVAVYVSDPQGRQLRGPFEARRESLRVKPQFQSQQAAADLDDVDSFWVANVTFPRDGKYVLTALLSLDGKLVSSSQMEMPPVGRSLGPPNVGEKAISVHTDTVASAGGDLASIDTRLPPLAELHEKDLADVLGKEPIVLAMATPQLCQTRVCGPVVDVAAEVRNETDGVTFIHQEIYNENTIEKGFRKPVLAWRLPTEPWVFLIGSDGRVVERFEGALSVRELSAAVKKLS